MFWKPYPKNGTSKIHKNICVRAPREAIPKGNKYKRVINITKKRYYHAMPFEIYTFNCSVIVNWCVSFHLNSKHSYIHTSYKRRGFSNAIDAWHIIHAGIMEESCAGRTNYLHSELCLHDIWAWNGLQRM